MHRVVDSDQEAFVELERTRMLLHNLPDDIEKLCEHRCHLLVVAADVTTAVGELVSESEPILFDEHLESINGAIVWVQYQRGQCCVGGGGKLMLHIEMTNINVHAYSKSAMSYPIHRSSESPH